MHVFVLSTAAAAAAVAGSDAVHCRVQLHQTRGFGRAPTGLASASLHLQADDPARNVAALLIRRRRLRRARAHHACALAT
eukprot:1064397-Pleurochrysis_carterae.AAC.1